MSPEKRQPPSKCSRVRERLAARLEGSIWGRGGSSGAVPTSSEGQFIYLGEKPRQAELLEIRRVDADGDVVASQRKGRVGEGEDWSGVAAPLGKKTRMRADSELGFGKNTLPGQQLAQGTTERLGWGAARKKVQVPVSGALPPKPLGVPKAGHLRLGRSAS